MTIDEFIKELESKAEVEKERAFYDAVKWNCITAYGAYCRKLESEYNQLAEWLKELKAHREAWDGMKEGLLEMSRLHEYVSIKHMIQLIDKVRPKEGDAE